MTLIRILAMISYCDQDHVQKEQSRGIWANVHLYFWCKTTYHCPVTFSLLHTLH